MQLSMLLKSCFTLIAFILISVNVGLAQKLKQSETHPIEIKKDVDSLKPHDIMVGINLKPQIFSNRIVLGEMKYGSMEGYIYNPNRPVNTNYDISEEDHVSPVFIDRYANEQFSSNGERFFPSQLFIGSSLNIGNGDLNNFVRFSGSHSYSENLFSNPRLNNAANFLGKVGYAILESKFVRGY